MATTSLNPTVTETPPGWYPDPEFTSQQRYWDGTSWTEHRSAPAAPAPPPGQVLVPAPEVAADDHTPLSGWAVVIGILFPIVGFIYGIVLLGRNRVGPGIALMLASIVAFFVWTAILASGNGTY